FRQEGSVDESTLGYSSRWGYHTDTSGATMEEVYEEELTLDHWVDPRGRRHPFGKMALLPEEVLSQTDFEDLPIKQEVHEATGNEGVTMERWYHQAVLVVWPPSRTFRILARQGQASAIPALADLIAKADDPAREECRTFAEEIIANWKVPEYGRDASQSA